MRRVYDGFAAPLIGAALAMMVGLIAQPAEAQGGRDDSLISGEPRGAGESMSCRDAATSQRRLQIAGGQDARVEDFPFMVQVRVGGGLCGGSMIAPGFIMTAAHCVMPPPGARACRPDGPGKCALADPASIQVVRPGPDGRATGETAGATRVFAHPGFRYPTGPRDLGALDADVALIRLDRVFEERGGDYVSVSDAAFDQSFTKGEECARVAGWGLTHVRDSRLRIVTEGPKTDKLQALNLALQSKERCATRYPGEISDNMLCAGDGVEGFNTCQGDSGGPLVMDVGGPVQVGVVSWAYGCAQAEHFTIFARVGARAVREWIDGVMSGRGG
ncbi:MAG: serine protease [Pseudomonadota bacterium]